MDVWAIQEHGGGKTMAVSRADVVNKLETLVRDRGAWYIERLLISDSDGNRYNPEVTADGSVELVLRSGKKGRRH
jgi:hypothetical protein